jgi:signal transduction histidine kinase
VSITLSPPFWRTWWFQGLVLLALVGGTLGGIFWRVRSLEARGRELAELVEERTAALSQTNLKLAQEIDEREKAEAALAQQAAETAVVEERNRLARDLHDAVTQTLFSASLVAEVLPRLWKQDRAEGESSLAELQDLTRGALAEMRALLLELRPAGILETDLDELLRHLAESVTGRARLPVTVKIDGEGEIPPKVKVALYRIAQEALNNITKHAEASKATVFVQNDPDRILLRVRDDGDGFDPDLILPTSLGLGIMQERAEEINARLTVRSQPGEGTEVIFIWWPEEEGDL